MSAKQSQDRVLVAIRHGQTDWNVEQRFQGHLDIPLNAAGYSQAEALRLRLAAFRFDAAYSSPLRRALATAQIIASDLPVLIDTRLIEIHHGCWQGRTKQDIAERWPHEWDQWNREPQRFTPSGGETAACIRARIEDFLNTMQGTNILCVSHGVVIQTLLSILLGGRYLEPNAYEPANGSIHTVRFRNKDVSDYRTERIA
jgi:broad specificity phosphatase PhoE